MLRFIHWPLNSIMKKRPEFKRILHIIILFLFPVFVFGQSDTIKGLQTETFLHPADGFTAYTLKKRRICL